MKSLAWTVLICMPEKFTNFVFGGLAAAESGYIAAFAFTFFTMVARSLPWTKARMMTRLL